MHDESPGGQACADRTLAYWTDQNNFPQGNVLRRKTNRRIRKQTEQLSNTQRFGAGFLIGTILAAMIGG